MFNPADWYWIVASDETRVYSSARLAYVDAGDPAFRAWQSEAAPSRIVSEPELREVLAAYGRQMLASDPPPPAPRDLAAEIDELRAQVERAGAVEAALIAKGAIARADVDARVDEAATPIGSVEIKR